MKQTVYVIFQDHEDKFIPYCEWDSDYHYAYRCVVGTENEARGIIQDHILYDYYAWLTNYEVMTMWADYYDDYTVVDDMSFDVCKDDYNKMVYYHDGDYETLYWEEVEITT